MLHKVWLKSLLLPCGLAAVCLPAQSLSAQGALVTHNLTLNDAAETIDIHGRRVLVASVQGDLSGVLTLALVVSPNGVVTGGEWALNVSYLEYGPPDDDADGDASEKLVQRGVVKGQVGSGSIVPASDGLPSDLSAIQLSITGATLEFAAVKTGTGTVTGNSMNQRSASTGTLSINF